MLEADVLESLGGKDDMLCIDCDLDGCKTVLDGAGIKDRELCACSDDCETEVDRPIDDEGELGASWESDGCCIEVDEPEDDNIELWTS